MKIFGIQFGEGPAVKEAPSNAIDSSNYVAPPHVHFLCIDRSEPTITDAGSVYAHCCVQGCTEGVFMSPNMAAVWQTPDRQRQAAHRAAVTR